MRSGPAGSSAHGVGLPGSQVQKVAIRLAGVPSGVMGTQIRIGGHENACGMGETETDFFVTQCSDEVWRNFLMICETLKEVHTNTLLFEFIWNLSEYIINYSLLFDFN